MENRGEASVPIPLDFFRQSEASQGDGSQLLDFPQFSEQIAAVAIPKADITYREIDAFAIRNVQCGLIPVRRVNDVPAAPDESGNQLKTFTLILDDQNVRSGRSALGVGVYGKSLPCFDVFAGQVGRQPDIMQLYL